MGTETHTQHPEEFPESCRDLDYSQIGAPETGLGILLSILRKGLTGNKRMPEKMDAVSLVSRGTKTQSETYTPKCWCRFLKGESQ